MSTWNVVTIKDKAYTVESSVIDSTTPPVAGTFRLNKISQQGEKKERCALCCCYYEKTSVSFKVPNHRISALLESKGYALVGKRYKNASFLYSLSKVCVFCAQMFSDIDEEGAIEANKSLYSHSASVSTFHTDKVSKAASLNTTQHEHQADSEIKVNPTSGIHRSDIAYLQKAFQCSQVDQYNALYAVSKQQKFDSAIKDGAIDFFIDPISSEIARTRRGLDPWWEVEFDSKRHVHSIVIGICGPIHAKLFVSVFLLDEAIGFEDPFLDSIVKKAKQWKEFVIPEQPESCKLVRCNWVIPSTTYGQAVRVQLRGIQTLALSYVHCFQGNEINAVSKFASKVRPKAPSDDGSASVDGSEKGSEDGDEEKEDKKDANPYRNMQLHVRDSSFVTISPEFIHNERQLMMSPIQKRKRIFKGDPRFINPKKYNEVNSFDRHIDHRYHVINEWIERVRKFSQVFTAEEIQYLYKLIFCNILESKEGFNKKELEVFKEDDLFGQCLIFRNPRCELMETFNRIKQIFRWCQARSHAKLLGPLQTCSFFVQMCEGDLEDYFHKLNNEVKAVQRNWESFPYTPANLEKRGVSWSQLLLMMSLFCTKQYFRVGPLVFSVGVDRDDEIMRDDDSTKSKLSKEERKSILSNKKAIDFLKGLGFDDASEALSVSINGDEDDGRRGGRKGGDSNSEKGKLVPKLDPALELSKFKLNLLKKRDAKHLNFPKSLDLNFAASLVPSRTLNKTTGSAGNDSPSAAASPYTSSFVDSGADIEIELQRVCALCNLHFPTSAMEIQVLWKHVIKLRRRWDPALVPKEIEMLENTVSMYNLVYCCIFCSQYFDPDFEGGIAEPIREGMSVIPNDQYQGYSTRPTTRASTARTESGSSALNTTTLTGTADTLVSFTSSQIDPRASLSRTGSPPRSRRGRREEPPAPAVNIRFKEVEVEKLIKFYDGRYPIGGLQEALHSFNRHSHPSQLSTSMKSARNTNEFNGSDTLNFSRIDLNSSVCDVSDEKQTDNSTPFGNTYNGVSVVGESKSRSNSPRDNFSRNNDAKGGGDDWREPGSDGGGRFRK